MLLSLFSAPEIDEERFMALLYESRKEKILAIAYGILQDPQDAEDALGEVMYKIIKNRGRFLGKSQKEINRQIVIYTRSTAIDMYRKKQKHIETRFDMYYYGEDSAPSVLDIPDPGGDVLMQYIERCEDQALARAFAEIPPAYADALKLRALLDYSYEEIAVALGTTAAVARKRCERARTLIKEKMRGETDGNR